MVRWVPNGTNISDFSWFLMIFQSKMNIFRVFHYHGTPLKQNRYDFRNQREKLHLIMCILAKTIFWPKLTWGPPKGETADFCTWSYFALLSSTWGDFSSTLSNLSGTSSNFIVLWATFRVLSRYFKLLWPTWTYFTLLQVTLKYFSPL